MEGRVGGSGVLQWGAAREWLGQAGNSPRQAVTEAPQSMCSTASPAACSSPAAGCMHNHTSIRPPTARTLDLPICQPSSPSTRRSIKRTKSRSSSCCDAGSVPSIQKWSTKSGKGSLVG